MDNSKRSFLKGAGAVAASMMMPMRFFMKSAHAAGAGRKLVVFNMHGGNDGLNLAIPTGPSPITGTDQYLLYQGYRSTIQIPLADLLPFGADASGQEFMLNPAMSALQPYFNKLALFPATHSSTGSYEANRSHFYQMDLYGAGMEGVNPISPDGKGWIGRFLDNKYANATPPSGIIGQDFTDGSHGTVRGNTFVLQMGDPSNISLGASSAITDDIWADTKDISNAQPGTHAGDFRAKQVKLFDEILARLRGQVDFTRTANAAYPSGVGTNFKYAADMLLDLPELEVVHIEMDGFDTHTNQVANSGGVADPLAGRQADLFTSLAQAIAAFYDDLSVANPVLRSNIIVTVQTEFGRTIRENGNFGTDHGNASCWMAFGDHVQGGVYGSYPSIDAANLNGGNWLRPTIDYREIFTEVLGPAHMGLASPELVFPGYTLPANPLGFVV